MRHLSQIWELNGVGNLCFSDAAFFFFKGSKNRLFLSINVRPHDSVGRGGQSGTRTVRLIKAREMGKGEGMVRVRQGNRSR